MPTTFGLPNTLPPAGRSELRSWFVFAGMGLFVLLIGLYPNLRPSPRLALPLAVGWLALPVWGVFRFLMRRRRVAFQTEKLRSRHTHAGRAIHNRDDRRWHWIPGLG